jgi:hypothetical protein
MSLTRNEHHMKMRVSIRHISDWLVNADAFRFLPPPAMDLPSKDAPPFVPPQLPAASHKPDDCTKPWWLPQKGHNKEKHLLILSALLYSMTVRSN